MTSNRDSILRKVRALLSKTTDNGCTEAEMMAALNRAQAIMDEHDISDTELQETKAEEADIRTSEWKTDPHMIKRRLSVEIGLFTGSKVWRERKTTKLMFCGLPSDTEFAIWLIETLSLFVFTELAKHLRDHRDEINDDRYATSRKDHIEGFVSGCTMRINARLRAIRIASEQKFTNNKNALMVIKSELIKKKLAGMSFTGGGTFKLKGNVDSFKAGKAAAEKASFGRPVGGEGGVLRIGRK